MSTEYTIVCDRCSHRIAVSSRSAAAARADVVSAGGAVRTPRYQPGERGIDLCPGCVEEAKQI